MNIKLPTVLLIGLSGALASEFRSGDFTLASDQALEGDLYFYGDNLTIAGQLEGDLVAVASRVAVDGTVAGDVLVAAESLTVEGEVTESVRSATATLRVAGQVGRDLVAVASDLELSQTGQVGGSFYGASGTMVIDGEVGEALHFSAGEFSLRGRVAGDLIGSASWLELRSDAMVGGDFVYHSPDPADIAPTVQIGGKTNYQSQADFGFEISPWTIGFRSFVGLFIFGLLLLGLRPALVARAIEATQFYGLSFLYGFAALLAGPAVAIFLILVGIVIGGWWVGALLMAGLAALGAGGVAVVGSVAGKRVLGPGGGWGPRIAALALGLLAVVLVALIPVVGPLLFMIALAWGVGALLLAIFGQPVQTAKPPA